LLFEFTFLPTTKDIVELALFYCDEYGLLPNDALILATCKHYHIKYLATLDEDFIEPAKKERIKLIMNPEDVKRIK